MAISIEPLVRMADDARAIFEELPATSMCPEIGSRAMRRLVDGDGSSWIVVQRDRYRYHAAMTARGLMVRLVLREYLACGVAW